MNVQNRRGGAVHHSTSGGTPSCNPWQSAAKFREVKDDVTCKQCIRRGYEEAEEGTEEA